jgi:hypothetical protein
VLSKPWGWVRFQRTKCGADQGTILSDENKVNFFPRLLLNQPWISSCEIYTRKTKGCSSSVQRLWIYQRDQLNNLAKQYPTYHVRIWSAAQSMSASIT